jgi:glycosyltransferase involved in cell wall biosynthesis
VTVAERDAALLRLHGVQPDRRADVELVLTGPVEYDVSVIIPVYNAERYVAPCLRSVLQQQTRFRFEVIVVDDGSTDSSREVIAATLESGSGTPRVSVHHKANGGPGDARNLGISAALGRYLTFVDSDDLLTPTAVEDLVSTAVGSDADFVQAGHVLVESDFMLAQRLSLQPRPRRREPRTVDQSEHPSPAIQDLDGYGWGKLFARQLFEGGGFPPHYHFQDTMVTLTLAHRARRLAVTDAVGYIYNTNDTSISSAAARGGRGLDILYVIQYCLDANHRLGIDGGHVLYRQLLAHVGKYLYRRTAMLAPEVRHDLLTVAAAILQENLHLRDGALSARERLVERAVLHRDLAAYVRAVRDT